MGHKKRGGKNGLCIRLAVLLALLAAAASLLSYGLVSGWKFQKPEKNAPDLSESAAAAAAGKPDPDMRKQIEECLPGVLAAQISDQFGSETLKAQAVLARSLLYWAAEHVSSAAADTAVLDDAWFSEQKIARDENWQAGGAKNRFLQAVKDTAYYVLTYEGGVILPLYHVCSAGRTRDGGTEFAYLVSRESASDLLVDGSLHVLWLSAEDFSFALSQAAGKQVLVHIGEAQELPQIETDTAGYAQKIVISDEAGGGKTEIAGELAARELGLAGMKFEWDVCGGQIRIACRGIGHGYGFSQWGAQALYEQGCGWEELLEYYFPETEITKTE